MTLQEMHNSILAKLQSRDPKTTAVRLFIYSDLRGDPESRYVAAWSGFALTGHGATMQEALDRAFALAMEE